MTDSSVSAEDWIKGITLSVMASMIGGASKLAIRKSWLIELEPPEHGVEQVEEVEGHRGAWIENGESVGGAISYSHLSDEGGSESKSPSVEYPPAEQEEATAKKSLVVAYALRLSGMIGMTFLNPICSVLAMNYASPSILAPFSGLTLVWIVLFSNPIIGEQPSEGQVLAACLIVAGEVVVAIFGDHTNDDGVTLDELRASYLDPLFVIYLVVLILWMLTLGYAMKYSKRKILKRFAWGVSGGSITGLQNFLKDSLTILKASKALNQPHYPWYLYLMAVLAIATAFGGLLLLTACMKRYDATYSAAMFVGSFVVSASIMSAVHYSTFANLVHLWNFILYPLGLIVLMVGVAILVQETKEHVAEEEVPPDESSAANQDSSSTRHVELNEPLVQIVTEPGGGSDLAW